MISPLSPISAVAPLIFVVVLALFREGYEDYLRYRSDRSTNREKVWALKDTKFEEVCADQIKVGDLLLVKDG